MALDEATAALLEQMAASGGPAAARADAGGRRAAAWRRCAAGAGRDLRWRRYATPGSAVSGGFVPIRILAPAENPRGIIVYYHGGGWVLGGLDDSDPLGRHARRADRLRGVLVDYRLAPEYRFPAAVDDSWAALQWVARAALSELAGQPGAAVVAGDSAGGNLAAVMALRARTAGGPRDRAAGAGLPGDRLRPGHHLLPRPGEPAAC